MASPNEKDPLITFPEFVGVCEEAGLAVDNEAQMYADYRYGKAMSDLADELITSTEAGEVGQSEALGRMESLLNDVYGDGASEAKYAACVALGAVVLRYACEHLAEPEGKN